MMGTGEASGDGRAVAAAEAAIANPLIDDVSLKGAKGLIINITGGKDITLYEVDEAANRIKQEVDEEANIIYGTTCDDRLEGLVRVSIVATGIDANAVSSSLSEENFAPIAINNEIYKKEDVKTNDTQPTLYSDSENQNNSTDSSDSLHEEFQVNSKNNDAINFNDLNDFDSNTSLEKNENNERVENSILSDTNNEISEVAEVTVHEEEIPTNSINKYKPQTASESNVRRLSLFDTLSDKQVDKAEDIEITPEKSEPILSSQEASENDPEKFVDNDISGDTKNEFNPEENELNNLDEEFNQENEEELLDIPTFLRRQAN